MPPLTDNLVGHWPLTSDLLDHSPLCHATTATDVQLGKVGPNQNPNSAARFNGTTSALTVTDPPSLNPGTGSFTVTAWVHSDGT